MQKKHVANKAFLVNSQGRILFLRYAHSDVHVKTGGRLDAPGGRMEDAEHPLEGLRRELFEETGLSIDTTNAKPFYTDLWGVAGDVVNEPIVGIFYVVDVGDVQPTLSEEHTDFIWHDPRQELTGEVTDALRGAFQAYRDLRNVVVKSDETINGREGFGLVQVFTGNGKGKTTAGLGEAMRAVGAGKKVGIVFFDKGGEHYSERMILTKLGIDFVATGRDRIDPVTGRFDFSITDEDRAEARRGLEVVEKWFLESYDLIILDEVNSCLGLGMIVLDDVLPLVQRKPEQTELVLTGRNAPNELIEKAHLVTEMCLRKHYFYSGVPAREGIDY